MADGTTSARERIRNRSEGLISLDTMPLNPSDVGTPREDEGFSAVVNAPVRASRDTGAMEMTEDQRAGYAQPSVLGAINEAQEPVGALFRGANDIIATIGQPVINAVAAGLEAAGVVDKGVIDRDFLLRVFNSNDYESQKVIAPHLLAYGQGRKGVGEGFGETYLRPAGQMIASSVPFMGLTAKAAQMSAALPRIPLGQATTRQGVTQQMLDPYITRAGGVATAETALAGASGATLPIEEELFGTQTGLMIPGAMVGGSLAIQFSPTASALNWLGRKLGGSATAVAGARDDIQVSLGRTDPQSGQRGRRAQGELATAIKQAQETPEGQINVQRAQEAENLLNPYADEPIAFSPAEVTRDPTLEATQARVMKGMDQTTAQRDRKRKWNVLNAAQSFLDKNFRGSSIDDAPLWVVDQASGEHIPMLKRLEGDRVDLDDAWHVLTGEGGDRALLPSVRDRSPTGSQIRQGIVEGHAAALTGAGKKARDLGINNSDPWGSKDSFSAAQARVRSQILTRKEEDAVSYAGLPRVVKDFLEHDVNNLTFQDWKRYRDQVSGAIGAEKSKTARRDIAIVLKSLDDMGKDFGKTNEKFRVFQDFYDATVVLPYERSAVLRTTRKGPGNRPERPIYLTADEDVADAFLTSSETAGQYMTLFGDDPLRMRAIAYSPSTSRIKPDAINKYANNNREVLNTLGMYDDVVGAENLVRGLLARNADLTARERVIGTNRMFRALIKSQDVQDPNLLIDEALKFPPSMRELRDILKTNFKGDELIVAENNLRAAVMDRMLAQAPEGLADRIKEPIRRVSPEKFVHDSRRSGSHALDIATVRSPP